MVLVDDQVRIVLEEGGHKLVGRHEIIESVKRDRVLDSRIVGVERDDVGDAHFRQLLKSHGAVQGLPLAALVLASLVQKRHDHADPVGSGSARADDALHILIMIVRGHVIDVAVHGIGKTVIGDVGHDEHVSAAHGFVDDGLRLAGAEPGAGKIEQI